MLKPTYAEVVNLFEQWITFEYGEERLKTHGGSLGLYIDYDIMSLFSGYIEGYYKAYDYFAKERVSEKQ